MNQTRRDILKAMLLAPIAGLPAVTKATVKPAIMDFSHPGWSSTQVNHTQIHRYQLTFPDSVARRSFAFFDLPGRANADEYRGFAPGTLRIVNMQIFAKHENRDALVEFELREPTRVVGAIGIEKIMAEYEQRSRAPFSALPDGKFVEIEPVWSRDVLVNSNGKVIA